MTKYSVFRGIARIPVWVTVEVTEGMTTDDEERLANEIYENGDGQEDWSGADYEDLEWEHYEDEDGKILPDDEDS